jgi:hypothetical protein
MPAAVRRPDGLRLGLEGCHPNSDGPTMALTFCQFEAAELFVPRQSAALGTYMLRQRFPLPSSQGLQEYLVASNSQLP